jgi:hypothetical protein
MLKVFCKIFLCAVLLSFCVCKTNWINTSKDNDQSGANSVAQLQIMPSDVTGWQQTNGASGWETYSASNLHNLIDGGDMQYTSRGLIEMGQQTLGSGQKILIVYCMDFGNAANSKLMYGDKYNANSPLLAIPNFPDSVAIATPTLGGVTAFAIFGKFYLELAFQGFQDQAEALRTTSLFIDLYSSKIE